MNRNRSFQLEEEVSQRLDAIAKLSGTSVNSTLNAVLRRAFGIKSREERVIDAMTSSSEEMEYAYSPENLPKRPTDIKASEVVVKKSEPVKTVPVKEVQSPKPAEENTNRKAIDISKLF